LVRTYCTLFDKNYLYQAVALYRSLVRHAGEFRLYALCMDATAYDLLRRMAAPGLIPVSVEELLTTEVAAVRARTTHGQFCWVCQPLICRFILDTQGCDMVTYLEADSLFFADPEILFQELGDASVSLVPHNYSPGRDNTAAAGRFCVQFNAFRADGAAAAVLAYWRRNCFQYSKEKPTVYPGQTCLNDWPERFESVRVITHKGAGVAPWNIEGMRFELRNGAPYVDSVPVVFYHYHQYGRYHNGTHELGGYRLVAEVIEHLYAPYAAEIAAAEEAVQALDPTFNYRRSYDNPLTLGRVLRSPSPQRFVEYARDVRRRLRGTYNVLPADFYRKG
jgi:hypothetical protein